MVKRSRLGSGPADLDAVFAALADPTRRAIVARLAKGETTVSDLASPFDMSLPAVTKHLAVLERAGLVAGRKEGRVRRCRLVPRRLRDAERWAQRYASFWETRMGSLAAHLERRSQ
jgi:DNA-binding transcriptional ArsR family regulator